MKAGVLALQGDFREHLRVFEDLGVGAVEVRTPSELSDVDCLAIPGGESTTMAKLAVSAELVEPIRERARAGMPILGTCAGMIVLAERVDEGVGLFGLMDVAVRRNAYGRQTESFETDVDVRGTGMIRAVFIRAPWVEEIGPDVSVLAEYDGRPVVLEQGNMVAASFHPELVGEGRLHAYLLEKL
ncbi:MAG: pyridoxal 5'-phosphate synthase glutaminase subunit PdxT [Actinomycetota bacterium]|nr:pyridoxal 5'-phosphate synthase glutaminase subunit PdxT [Actinomycetota bacterium]